MVAFGADLKPVNTGIPGLVLWQLPVHGDSRGWFKENWQRAKMVAAGLPDFGPVQNNVSFNDAVGTTRGIHAEPWDKWVSVATGKIFGAWVDLREGATFGAVFTAEIDASKAVFVPRGVGNAFQTLEPETAYSYLVNDHWSPDATYTFLNVADETAAIAWPIPLEEAETSAKDKAHPRLVDVVPMPPRKILVLGANGQVGRAMRRQLGDQPHIEYADRLTLDLSEPGLGERRHWRDYATVINAAAYTAVDQAETADGRTAAWAANVTGVAALARIATEHGITLVHVSSDYVFDGTASGPHLESERVAPMGVYGQTKAAGDNIVATVPRHYVVRTSWVIGDGQNFVDTMWSLAQRGVSPRVVNDQIGRLTFAEDIARGIMHLLASGASYGVYNLTGTGEPTSWADVARAVFELAGRSPEDVTGVSTEDYFASATGPVAPRPRNSVLDLSRIVETGFEPRDALAALDAHLRPRK